MSKSQLTYVMLESSFLRVVGIHVIVVLTGRRCPSHRGTTSAPRLQRRFEDTEHQVILASQNLHLTRLPEQLHLFRSVHDQRARPGEHRWPITAWASSLLTSHVTLASRWITLNRVVKNRSRMSVASKLATYL